MPKLIGDKLDVYRAHFLEDQPLTPTQKEMLERYNSAWSKLCSGYSRQQTIKFLLKEYGISQPQSYAIIRDAIALLGNAQESNREGKLAMQIERLRRLSKKAEKEGDYKAAVRAEVEAAKLEGLYDAKATAIDPKLFLKPGAIVFVTNPSVLQQQDETEDADHEELE